MLAVLKHVFGVHVTNVKDTMYSVVAQHDSLDSKNWKGKLNKFIEKVPDKVKNLTEPVVLIQAHVRAYIARKKYKQRRKAAIQIQCSWKRLQAQKELEKRKHAAEVIRSFIRGFINRRQPESDVNRMFLQHLRIRFLYELAEALPKSVTDKNWPVAPSACKEASELLRTLHRRILVRNYFRSLTPQQIDQLKWKLEASELFKGKKSSYSRSLEKPFDPMKIPENLAKQVPNFANAHFEKDESSVYAACVVKFDRHGYKPRQRVVILTTKKIYLVDEKFKLKHEVSLKTMTDACVNVSTMNDGLLILRIYPTSKSKNKEGDLVLDFGDSLIEFVSQLTLTSQNRKLLHRSPNSTMHHHIGEGKVGTIRFQKGIEYEVIRSKSGQSLIVSS